MNILVSNTKASAEQLSEKRRLLLGDPGCNFLQLALFVSFIHPIYGEHLSWARDGAKFATYDLHNTCPLLVFSFLIWKMGVWVNYAWGYPRFQQIMLHLISYNLAQQHCLDMSDSCLRRWFKHGLLKSKQIWAEEIIKILYKTCF